MITGTKLNKIDTWLIFFFGGGGGGELQKISSLWNLQVGPGLGPSCLQRLSADNTSRQRVKMTYLKSISKTSLR